METAFHHQNGRAFHAQFMSIFARQFNGCLVGLGPGVAKKYIVHIAGQGQFIGQGFLQTDSVQIGRVD